MKKIPKFSESEWQLMMVLWTRSPHEIVNSLSKKTLWKPKNIKTPSSRLVTQKTSGKTEGEAENSTLLAVVWPQSTGDMTTTLNNLTVIPRSTVPNTYRRFCLNEPEESF